MDLSNQYGALLLTLLNGTQKKVKKAYFDAILDITAIAAGLPYHNTIFTLAAYPLIKTRVDYILKRMQTEIYSSVLNGIDGTWQLSDKKNTVLINKQLKGIELTDKARKIYFDPNEAAKEAFENEKIKGLTLSDRVWNLVDEFQPEIERNLAYGIATGESAASMATRMKKYLNDPDNVIRRIKTVNDKGEIKIRLSKAAKDIHSGQGVYRSSYKNSLRLTRDQVNRSYRRADNTRWLSLSFVVGIQIDISNSHPAKPENEMCEQLAGRYPKDFDWEGWHTQCLCHATPIFITSEEKKQRRTAILNGEEWKGGSANEVKDVPETFKMWYKNNKERVDRLKTMPDFIKNNKKYLPKEKDKAA